jgi:hypothetical protein
MTNKQRQNANRKLADKTLKLVLKRLNKEKHAKKPATGLGIFKTVDYYECPTCLRRLAKIQLETARYNFPCAGRLRDQCNNFLSDYKPVYKEDKQQ